MAGFTTTNKVNVNSKEQLNETVNKIIPKEPRKLSSKSMDNYKKAGRIKVSIKTRETKR